MGCSNSKNFENNNFLENAENIPPLITLLNNTDLIEEDENNCINFMMNRNFIENMNIVKQTDCIANSKIETITDPSRIVHVKLSYN